LGAFHYLGRQDIDALDFSDTELLAAVEAAFAAHGQGQALNEPRIPLTSGPGYFRVQRASMSPLGTAGIKITGDFPHNSETGEPSEPALMALFDTRDGLPIGIVDMSYLGPVRTGAVTAVAAKHLAPRHAHVLGHLGAGLSAYWNIRLLHGLFQFDEIRLHSKHVEHREALAFRLRDDLGCEIKVTENWRATVDGADVVVEATRLVNPEPLLKTQWVKRGACLMPYGSRSALELSIVDVADKIVVDDWARAQIGPMGALRLHIDSGRLTYENLYGELGEIISGAKPGRERDDEIILFWQRSLAAADIAIGHALIDKARRLNVGQTLPFG
jgi:ornithine cyclodeaminase